MNLPQTLTPLPAESVTATATTVAPQTTITQELKTLQNIPIVGPQLINNFPQFTSLHPNSLSGIRDFRVPFPYNTIRVPHPVPVPVHIKVPVTVEKPYAVQITKTVAVPVEKPIYIRIPQPIQVPVAQPYPVPVPQPIEVRVPHPVYIKVLPNGQQIVIDNFLKNN